jgi:hypothetical protein
MTRQRHHGDAQSRASHTTTGDLVIPAETASTDTPLFDATVRALADAPAPNSEAVATESASATESTNTASECAPDAALDTGSNTGEPDGPDDNPETPDQSVMDWVDHQPGNPSTRSAVIDPDTPEGMAILSLFRRIKDVEEGDGSWNGGAVANEVAEWLIEQGIDLNKGPTHARQALRTAVRERSGRGPASAVYGVRIGTDHHDPEPLIRTALHVLTRQLGPGTSIELVSSDRDLLARIDYSTQTLTPGS